MPMKIQESAQNYLERILMIQEEQGSVRSIDIVHELGFSKPSVSIAMKKLRENGYIKMDHDGYITLTDAGREIASSMYERHQILSELFTLIGVPEDIAIEDACRIEHYLHDETFNKLKEHLEKEHSIKEHV